MINIKDYYYAFVLSNASRNLIASKFPFKYSRKICHHVTIAFSMTDEDYAKFKAQFESNDKAIVKAVGYADGTDIEAIAVSINNETKRLDGSFYHVTLSLTPPKKPVNSNELYDLIQPIEVFELTGDFALIQK